jgi:hypothetical protein
MPYQEQGCRKDMIREEGDFIRTSRFIIPASNLCPDLICRDGQSDILDHFLSSGGIEQPI